MAKAKSRIKDFGRKYTELGQLRYEMKKSSKTLLNLWNSYKDGNSWEAHVKIDQVIDKIPELRADIKKCMRSHVASALKQVGKEYSGYLNSTFKNKINSIGRWDLTNVDEEVPFKVLRHQNDWVEVEHEGGERGWINEMALW